eukprot:gene15078-6245_t
MECEILSANALESRTDLFEDKAGWDHYESLQEGRCEAYDKEQLCDAEQVCEQDLTSLGGYKCKNLENIASGKVASQSSTCYEGAASRAVDGNDQTNYDLFSCSHTCSIAPDWWRVDFGGSAFVHSVKITNRVSKGTTLYRETEKRETEKRETEKRETEKRETEKRATDISLRNPRDCCGYRLSNFNIVVGNSIEGNGGSNTVCAASQSVPQGGTKLFPCRPRLHGRYLYIQQNKAEPLTLCEVRVFGEFFG